VEIDRLRSGKASALSIAPLACLQTACRASGLTHMANIFRARFNFESAATSVLYEPHKVGYEYCLCYKLYPASEDICDWAALFRF